jgi:hypothetical protein
MSWDKMYGASFLGQQRFEHGKFYLDFIRQCKYIHVGLASQFMSHDWELLVLSKLSYCKSGQNNVAENDYIFMP